MYTFIYSNLQFYTRTGMKMSRFIIGEHPRTPITLLNFPYIHSYTQSHSPRAPPWPAFCGLVPAVNQYVVASRA